LGKGKAFGWWSLKTMFKSIGEHNHTGTSAQRKKRIGGKKENQSHADRLVKTAAKKNGVREKNGEGEKNQAKQPLNGNAIRGRSSNRLEGEHYKEWAPRLANKEGLESWGGGKALVPGGRGGTLGKKNLTEIHRGEPQNHHLPKWTGTHHQIYETTPQQNKWEKRTRKVGKK